MSLEKTADKGPKVSQGDQAGTVRPDQLVLKDPRAAWVPKAGLVTQDYQVTKAKLEMPALKEDRVPWAQLVLKDLAVPMVLMVSTVSLVLTDVWDPLDEGVKMGLGV